ncbi:MAG: DUF721 domain-containing protein [Alphaproteobacteria bacterium]|nr:DUF721 domain-containing protein [Alphaproteobacteria bacterium]
MRKGGREDKTGAEEPEPPRVFRKAPIRAAASADRLARLIAEKRGFPTLTIARRWRDIAGEALAAHTQPMSLTLPKGASEGGTLTLKADGGAALLVQHHQREIIARANGLLGPGVVAAIKLVQGHVAQEVRAPKPPAPRLSAAEDAAVTASVAGVGDEALRDGLARLMRHAVADTKRR